jgi:hypothetical protein
MSSHSMPLHQIGAIAKMARRHLVSTVLGAVGKKMPADHTTRRWVSLASVLCGPHHRLRQRFSLSSDTSPAHPIALQLRPSRARSGGRRRGLLLWGRFEGKAARQQCRRENQNGKPFNHDGLTTSAMVRYPAVRGQGDSCMSSELLDKLEIDLRRSARLRYSTAI